MWHFVLAELLGVLLCLFSDVSTLLQDFLKPLPLRRKSHGSQEKGSARTKEKVKEEEINGENFAAGSLSFICL